MRKKVLTMASVTALAFIAYVLLASTDAVGQTKDKASVKDGKDTNKEALKGKSPGPKDDALYVWNQPDRGYQSVIVLKAVAPDTLECGLIVPITLRLKDIEAVPGNEKKIIDALGEEAVGRLLTAALAGRAPDGSGTYSDFWLGEKRGWMSEALLSSGLYRKKQAIVPPTKK